MRQPSGATLAQHELDTEDLIILISEVMVSLHMLRRHSTTPFACFAHVSSSNAIIIRIFLAHTLSLRA